MKTKSIYITITLLAALLSILLPGYLLQRKRAFSLNAVKSAPEEYYSGSNSVMAKNASAKLTSYERARLVTGVWESEVSEAKPKEATRSEYDAVLLAQKNLEPFYQSGVYPVSLSSDSGDWYSWEAHLWKAVDNTFHTYTAYYWEISLTRYEGSENHTIIMLDDGTIIRACADMEQQPCKDIRNYCQENFKKNYMEPSILVNNQIAVSPYLSALANATNTRSYFVVTGDSTITSYEQLKERYKSSDHNEYYCVSQISDNNLYEFSIIPYYDN